MSQKRPVVTEIADSFQYRKTPDEKLPPPLKNTKAAHRAAETRARPHLTSWRIGAVLDEDPEEWSHERIGCAASFRREVLNGNRSDGGEIVYPA